MFDSYSDFLVKRLNNYLKSQLLVQVQALKTKESELSVTKSELKTAKADVKMQIQHIKESNKSQIEAYVEEINKLKSTHIQSSQIS